MDRARLVFFSRGRGRGHAVPDIVIADALQRLEPDIDATFASYATGADTFRMNGRDVVDLGLPEEPAFPRLISAADALLGRMAPARPAVVAHEEFAVIPVARRSGHSCCFVSDWLPPPGSLHARCVDAADLIIFLDEPGHYAVPDEWTSRIHFVGPVHGACRPPAARTTIRQRLGVDDSMFVGLVAHGGTTSHGEDTTPMARLLLEAWNLLPDRDRLLIWLGDASRMQAVLRNHHVTSRVILLAPHHDFIDTMAACDVVVTKGNRVTTLEADALGIPSISVSYGVNPIDDHRISRIDNNLALSGDSSPHLLAARLLECRARGRRQPHIESAAKAVEDAAVALRAWLSACLGTRSVR